MEQNLRKPDVVTVAVTQAGGGLTIMRVVENEYAPDPNDGTKRVLSRHFDITPAYIDSLIAKHVEGGNWSGDTAPVGWRFVPNDFVDETTDRHFRDAWKDAPGKNKPEVHMPKAREIHIARLRKLRARALDTLDNEYMLADEAGDVQKKKEIAAKKQALRDITTHPAIAAAQTPEELKLAGMDLLQ